MLCSHYLHKLLEFCNLFQPPIPRAALVSDACYTTPCILYSRKLFTLVNKSSIVASTSDNNSMEHNVTYTFMYLSSSNFTLLKCMHL